MPDNFALLTDFYELTMMQGYHRFQHNPRVVFEMFFRKAPFGGGFSVFAGLADLLSGLEKLKFHEDDIAFLADQKIFAPEFLDYLASFRFSGDVYAMDEGTLVFPNEPLVRVHAPLIEAQLIESFLLNVINFQTLIATKAARVYLASEEGQVLEFGLRRAHGVNGALAAARAAYIGGAEATSNTMAGKLYGIPVRGTMAHSWVMAFDEERLAFENYARIYPEGCILLIDTYDTLASGLENAIAVGRALKEHGYRGFGVRLDSGDLEYLSKEVRRRLDEAGLPEARIAASNELDEHIINQLVAAKAPIDVWGVGTNLVTAKDDPSLAGVYKLKAREENGVFRPTIKVSNNPEKTTDPGIKQVHRFINGSGAPIADLIALADETVEPGKPHRFYHPRYPYRYLDVDCCDRIEPLISQKMKGGRIDCELPSLQTIQAGMKKQLKDLDHTYKRILNPHVYKVSLSRKLKEMKFKMIEEYSRGRGKA
jgi:nicotinate phosphoribosyltransferase